MNVELVDFFAHEKNSIKVLIDYCKNVVVEKVSTDHFPVVPESILPTRYSEYALKDINPFPRPVKLDKEFGHFNVSQVDTEHARLQRFNTGKAIEYGNLYTNTSHLFDSAV
jgi:hypothetical protein